MNIEYLHPEYFPCTVQRLAWSQRGRHHPTSSCSYWSQLINLHVKVWNTEENGLHQEKCGQQVEEADSAPLLRSGETHLESCVQLWSPQHTKGMDLLEQIQRRPQKWSEGWSTSPVRKGWESWGSSAWRREGCGETLEQPSSTFRGPTEKMGTIFSAGFLVIGWGVMALNWKKADLD